MDYNEELRNIQGNQSAILDTQQLLIETISFVLDSSEGIKRQLESIENEISDIKNDLQQNQAMYATALLEQTNFFRQLIAGLQNDNQKSMEQISEIEKQNFLSLSEKLKSDYESLKKQIDNIVGNNDGIHKYLASLEELMRLVAANQLIKEVEKQITNDMKISYEEVAVVAATISHVKNANIDKSREKIDTFQNVQVDAIETKLKKIYELINKPHKSNEHIKKELQKLESEATRQRDYKAMMKISDYYGRIRCSSDSVRCFKQAISITK